MADKIVAAHEQKVTHSYVVAYPEHGPREGDPAYVDFHHFKTRRREAGTYHCDFAVQFRDGDTSECDNSKPLEAHHTHLEWAFLNEVDDALLEEWFPGITKETVGKWVESDENLELLCVFHHRGVAGKHVASYADFEGSKYVRHLISKV